MQRVNLELIVADYDRIGSSDPIGKVLLGYNRKALELKHWKEMIENPRRPIVHWHVLKVMTLTAHRIIILLIFEMTGFFFIASTFQYRKQHKYNY